MVRWPTIERPARAAAGLLAAALSAGTAGAQTAELAFARRGEPVTVLSLAAMRRAVEPGRVRVHEPYEEREAAFAAFPLAPVLDAAYGRGWRDEQELLFTCLDGYQPTVPVSRVLAHRPWLAFDRVDAREFTIRKRESGTVKQVSLAPFYLVWENLDDPQVRQEGDYGWPYQLVGIDLIRSADRFPRLAPPPDASERVRAGFDAFRVHCSRCHALNGEGGSVGPELNAPAQPLADRAPGWLRTWITDPQRIRPRTRMEPLNPRLPDRARVADDIVAYLQAMVATRAPGED